MADQPAGPLVEAARALGNVAGKIVAAVTGEPGAPPVKAKSNLWSSEYIGSGTFIIHQPKRKSGKRHQQRVKSPRPGMR
jgi:hypothetical protein